MGKDKGDTGARPRRRPALSLGALLRTADEGFWLVSNDNVIIDVNQKLCGMLGCTRKAVVGRSIYDFTDPANAETFRREGELRNLGKISSYEITLQRADKTNIHCRINASPLFGPTGSKSGAFALITDVTGRREGERMQATLAAAVEQAHDMVIITDAEGIIRYVNAAFEKGSGYAAHEALGKRPSMLKSGMHDALFYSKMWASIRRGETWEGRLIDRRKDGSLLEEKVVISPVKDASGNISGFVGVLKDVTQEAWLERAKDFFATITAHEMRTPLSKLAMAKMLLESMVDDHEDDRLKSILMALDDAYFSLERVETATSVVAGLARTIPGNEQPAIHQEMDRSPTHLANIIHYSVEQARKEMKVEQRKVKIQINEKALCSESRVECNFRLLTLAMWELLSNAVKYTPNDGKVEVSLEENGTSAAIVVRDHGRGIPPETLHTIFTPFFSNANIMRHSSGRYRYEGGGIGLGLSVAATIMRFHNGSINVESDGAGKGTTVRLALPLL